MRRRSILNGGWTAAGRRRRIAVAAVAVATVGVLSAPGTAQAYSSQLSRYPYLTDATTTSVRVNFATTVKIASAARAVRWGTPSGSTGCTLTGASVSATGQTVNAPMTVAGSVIYFSSITITGLSPTTRYCYRITTGTATGTDLLGTDTAPRFSTLPAGTAVTFDVFGDWGDKSVNSGAAQAKVDAALAASGAQFAVSTGDIGYVNGTQDNYGSLTATGADVSEVFGRTFWKAPGATLPLFSTMGNHGRSTTFFQNWPQPSTVSSSSGKYLMEPYSGQDSTTAVNGPSGWYAFNAGGARFYVLDADWSDTNVGTASGPYQVDHDYHFKTTSPEYRWLKADLAGHSNALKFAFFHFPLRADTATEGSDTYLQADPDNPTATTSLEGLLHHYGVDLAFNGHAHIYQRNVAPPGGVTSYVTGGGGAKAVPVYRGPSGQACSPTDAYAVGWGYTNAVGSSCGAAPTPTTDLSVYHYLKVAVSGTTVTVTPVAASGAVFDAQTYHFATAAAPGAPTHLTATATGATVTLAWTRSTSTSVSAQDLYRNGRFLATTVPTATSFVDRTPVAGARYTIRAHVLSGAQSGDSAAAAVG